MGLRAGNHHVAMNIINGFVFNDIHTHMIDDFLFSNPTAHQYRPGVIAQPMRADVVPTVSSNPTVRPVI